MEPNKGFFPYLCESEILTGSLKIKSGPRFLGIAILAGFEWSCRFPGLRGNQTPGLGQVYLQS
jgi:hypothetical protein